MFTIDQDGAYSPALISMSGSALKKAKKWNSMMNRLQIPHPNGKGTVNPAMFWTAYTLTTVPEQNDMGSWFNWEVTMKYDAKSGGIIQNLSTGENIYLEARTFRNKVTEGKDGKVTETTKVEEEKLDDGVEVKTDKTSSETWGIKKNGDKAVKIKGKLYSIKDNLEYLKTINDPTIKSHVDEAIKFGFNVNEIAPHGPQKYLDQKGIRGVKKINPAWKKLQDLEKSLTSVKPKKINKRKVR